MEELDLKNPKRARTFNFSLEEKLLVLNTAAKYKDVLENKRTASITCQKKNKIWEEITKHINAKTPSGCYRSMESLKRLYENEKKRARKVVAENKKQINLTGGGPPTEIKKDPCHELILSIVNNKTIYGLNNPFDGDSDCSHIQNIDSDVILEYRYENDSAISKSIQAISEQNKVEMFYPVSVQCTPTEIELYNQVNQVRKKCKPTDFQTPVNTPLQKNILCATSVNIGEANLRNEEIKNRPGNKSRRRPATTVKTFTSLNLAAKYEMLVNKKLEIVDIQKQKLQNEIEILQIEHKLKVKLLQKELELKEQQQVIYQK